MTDPNSKKHRTILQRIARRAMLERGLLPEFSAQALAELETMQGHAATAGELTRDLRHLIWCSIDNDDSRDLDQLTVAEAMPGGAAKIFVAIADVDALVKKDTAIDSHARQNTTSVYTEARIFPMLPEKLSTDLTSLNYASDRHSIVVEMEIAAEGSLICSDVYGALVQNRAKLCYNSLADWLDGKGPMPIEIGEVDGLAENLWL
jgi:exoribonuclease-2